MGLNTLAGLIDSGYRNEVCVIIHNDGSKTVRIQQGDRIAQLVAVKLTQHSSLTLTEMSELPDSERGKNVV